MSNFISKYYGLIMAIGLFCMAGLFIFEPAFETYIAAAIIIFLFILMVFFSEDN